MKPDLPAGHAVPDDERRKAEHAQGTYKVFLQTVWPIIEPGTPLVWNWHLDAICDHLEAVERGQIRHLLITMPPRFLKSHTSTVVFPTWVWTRNPGRRFLTASYDMGLSTEHAVLSRRIIESVWYQLHFGDRVRLTTDQNVKTHYENTARGYRMATSVGGAGTGHGGDILICDDPLNLEKRYSQAARKQAIDWRMKVWSSRLNDPKTGRFVDIMQRAHEKDVGAAILDLDGVEHLSLPQEYDPKRRTVTCLGYKDPRTKAGQLLCPERFGPAENAAAKRALGSDYQAQHQQNPQPEGGLLFKRDQFHIIDAMPAGVTIRWCRGWDCAATEDGGDYTAGVKMGFVDDGRVIVAHVVRGQWGPDKADKVMLQTVKADGIQCRQQEEQEPGSAGKKLIQLHAKLFRGYDYGGEPSTGDKATRARPFRAQCEAGNVYVLKGEWNMEYIDELCGFPNADYDDQVDASSNAFNRLALSDVATGEVTIIENEGSRWNT